MTDTTFRDLNKNSQFDPYEDASRPIEERIEDLLARMTLAEKAGMMFQTIVRIGDSGEFNADEAAFGRATIRDLTDQHITHFNLAGSAPTGEVIAQWTNELQKLAESKRLGIPITLSTDPRHVFSNNPGAHMRTGAFSQWPEPPGFGAIDDPDLVQEFGDIARQE